jgi:hypothetical protein
MMRAQTARRIARDPVAGPRLPSLPRPLPGQLQPPGQHPLPGQHQLLARRPRLGQRPLPAPRPLACWRFPGQRQPWRRQPWWLHRHDGSSLQRRAEPGSPGPRGFALSPIRLGLLMVAAVPIVRAARIARTSAMDHRSRSSRQATGWRLGDAGQRSPPSRASSLMPRSPHRDDRSARHEFPALNGRAGPDSRPGPDEPVGLRHVADAQGRADE